MTMPPDPSTAATCEHAHEPPAWNVEQVLECIDAEVRPVEGRERLGLREALDRVLACDVAAPFDSPPFASSAVDGYALRHEDLSQTGDTRLEVAGESFAGRPYPGRVNGGQCVRIMTGAVLPEGADTVVMQERVRKQDYAVAVPPGPAAGGNVRRAGDDLRRGETVLRAGRRLNAADLGLLASLGTAEVDVCRRPVVTFFSTGDELRGLGETLRPGEIHDSNRYTLHALLTRLDVNLRDGGVVRDEARAVTQALKTAAATSDLVVTSGGVSVGAADHIQQALQNLGKRYFNRVAVKPGRPLTFGAIGRARYFGLPGNPVSVMTGFLLFVRRAVQLLAGEQPAPLRKLRARCENPLAKSAGRAEYQRGILHAVIPDEFTVTTTGLQSSHVLSSMSRANCFIVLPPGCSGVEAGATVEVIPFDGLL